MYFVNELDFVCRDGWRSETPVGSPPSKFQDSGYIYFSLYKEVHVTSEHSVAKPEPPTKGGRAAPHHLSEKNCFIAYLVLLFIITTLKKN